MLERAYAPHEQLVRPGRAHAQLWKLVVGLLSIGLFVFALNTLLIGVIAGAGSEDWAQSVLTGDSPAAMYLLLGSFGIVILAVALAARQLQHRSLSSIIGPFQQTLVQFWRVLRILVILWVVVLILPPYDMGAPLESNLPLFTWLILLPFSLLAVLVQVSAEEILFRGYIQQALAARFRSPLVWMVLPSALFALGHYLPGQAGDNAVLIALWSGVFGILMADLTARAGTLGPAIALHLFNNMIALLFISLPDSLNGLSLFLVPYEMSDTDQLRSWLMADFAMMLVAWLAARLALRR
ncbi:CPBP family intramembrane metalloprotease [Tropicibacter sp. R16_0]|uniref:CPBP family intramembrane glutamic endopeptidase n=1 Tax=Tropicibacter sp. R16_0 TaxID=2821102 RepID=UPI001ADBDFFF|nr:CPBP family intramembrane glutamic endopeptidase [Tropicibacter sp. R16_0]MBO9450472.1 CPBP family intramembrane metalloprotease [Tropicibacter sp. R16_0]